MQGMPGRSVGEGTRSHTGRKSEFVSKTNRGNRSKRERRRQTSGSVSGEKKPTHLLEDPERGWEGNPVKRWERKINHKGFKEKNGTWGDQHLERVYMVVHKQKARVNRRSKAPETLQKKGVRVHHA